MRIRIQKKQGLPFFYRRSLKRKAFFIGIFLCLAGLYTLSQFIWNIHVEGNYANSTQTILNSLDAAGIHHGSWKKRVDCSQTASYLREQFPNLTWVSAKIEGTQLVLAVKENVDGYVIEEKADDPQNLVAKKEGTVVRIITRNGIPQVLPGDTCQAGDILVKARFRFLIAVVKRMIILLFTQPGILTFRRRGTILIPFRFPFRYGHIRKQRKKRRYSRFLLTDFSLEICCRRILWRVCGA